MKHFNPSEIANKNNLKEPSFYGDYIKLNP